MSIHQEVTIPASPDRVYAALTNGAQFAKLSGAPAEIATAEGGEFSMFGGAIHGRNVELVPDKRIVQAWRVKGWEPGVYSLVRFTLTADGKGTKIVLDHSSYPAANEADLAAGWTSRYFEPMTKSFA
jgi:uncharacterized protein YndB with AHSA1/START domain